jgi:hypothetical protein
VSNPATKTRQQAFMDVLFHGLRVADAALNADAALVLSQLSVDAVRRLVLVAAQPKNKVAHRLRALTVVERIGCLSGPDDWMDLTILAVDSNVHIRAAAGRCLATCPISGS